MPPRCVPVRKGGRNGHKKRRGTPTRLFALPGSLYFITLVGAMWCKLCYLFLSFVFPCSIMTPYEQKSDRFVYRNQCPHSLALNPLSLSHLAHWSQNTTCRRCSFCQSIALPFSIVSPLAVPINKSQRSSNQRQRKARRNSYKNRILTIRENNGFNTQRQRKCTCRNQAPIDFVDFHSPSPPFLSGSFRPQIGQKNILNCTFVLPLLMYIVHSE